MPIRLSGRSGFSPIAKQWKVRITGQPRKEPDLGLLVQAVLLLAEDLQRARESEPDVERATNVGPNRQTAGLTLPNRA
jgi:hypothetical protein